MSIFGSIMSKIFGHAVPAAEAAPAPGTPPAANDVLAPAAPAESVDVSAILTDMASKASQPLNWKSSIVDLMKLLGLESSLSTRTALAKELDYTGDTADSASMNVWLHAQVMRKLAANGGKVPADLLKH